jgi:hypothetical protein
MKECAEVELEDLLLEKGRIEFAIKTCGLESKSLIEPFTKMENGVHVGIMYGANLDTLRVVVDVKECKK